MPDISDEIIDIINKKTQEHTQVKKEEDKTPEVEVTLTSGEDYDEAKFSDLFWPPVGVPDHAVKVFKGYDTIQSFDENYIPPKEEFEKLSFSLSAGLKTLVVGPTGCGKTMMMEYFAYRTQRPFLRISHDQELDRARVFGRTDLAVEDGHTVTKFVKGVLPVSMTTPTLVVADELSRAPGYATIQYQSILDRRMFLAPEAPEGEQQIEANENWLIVGTDNTKGNGDNMDLYSASNVQDASFINRWDILIEAQYLDQDTEKEFIQKLAPEMSERAAMKLARFSELMHKGFNAGNIQTAFSPRNILAITKLFNKGMPIKNSLEMNYVSRVSESERSDVMESVNAVYGD